MTKMTIIRYFDDEDDFENIKEHYGDELRDVTEMGDDYVSFEFELEPGIAKRLHSMISVIYGMDPLGQLGIYVNCED